MNSSSQLRMLVFASLLAALMTAGAYISIPVGPVPIVLQNMFVFLAGLLLGSRWGLASVGVYLLAGACGLPVFAGGMGGLGRIVGPTGGYLIGYLPAVFIIGYLSKKGAARISIDIIAMICGTIVLYACGVTWLKTLTGMQWSKALAVGMYPFLVGDALKIVAAAAIARGLRPIIRIAGYELNFCSMGASEFRIPQRASRNPQRATRNSQRATRNSDRVTRNAQPVTRNPQRDMNIIEIENLTHRFADGTVGVESINLSIREGSFTVIAGPNGSGKTTLLRHLNGLLLPTEGMVRLADIPVEEDLLKARQYVGMMFQDADSQIVGETVYEDVAFGPENLRLERLEIQRRVIQALRTVGLQDLADQRPHLLSGGEKRRLAIAGVLAMEPRVIVFDEPFASLDYPGVKQVLQHMLDLHRSGHTIVVTTHDLEKVIAHADRLILMQSGRIVRDGSPEEIVGHLEAFGVREPCAYRLGLEAESWLN